MAAGSSCGEARHSRRAGDIWPAESARFLFLEALGAAKQKLYLLYNNKDLQKDQVLLPAVPLLQLERFLSESRKGWPDISTSAQPSAMRW